MSPSEGVIYLMKVKVPQTITATNVAFWLQGKGVTLTDTYVGLYTSSGALIGKSADVSASLTITNEVLKTFPPVSGPFIITGGPAVWVWAAMVSSHSGGLGSPPTILATYANQNLLNVNLTPATYFVATNGTGQTTLPATITPSANGNPSTSTGLWWMAIS